MPWALAGVPLSQGLPIYKIIIQKRNLLGKSPKSLKNMIITTYMDEL
jgi:hypothetical protein